MCGPHRQATCNHIEGEQSLEHTVKQSIEYITHVHIQAMTIEMNSGTDIMLKDDQDNIQAKENNTSI